MKFDDRLKPCPFCSTRGVIESHELKGKTYSTVGCPTKECFCYIHFQTAAIPGELLHTEIARWNRRA